jgi:hypothetical protein
VATDRTADRCGEGAVEVVGGRDRPLSKSMSVVGSRHIVDC